MDEILEGDVGRTVKFEGKEYWVKEFDFESVVPEPLIRPEDLESDFDSFRRLDLYRYFPVTKPPKISGIIEA